MSAKVDILLATYNGENFLRKQLDSILQQSFEDFQIIIRDDLSKDNSLKIIDEYKKKYVDKIKVLDSNENLGATQNFNALLEASTAPFVFFSDQDDVWQKDKLEKSFKLLKTNENIPCMVFSDLGLIDENDQSISASLYKRENINPYRTKTNQLLMQNVPYGCTIGINSKLKEKITPIPKEALLHDHWIALSASLLGSIFFIEKPTIQHRIHSKNTSRAESIHRKEQDKSLSSKLQNSNFNHYLSKQCEQAEMLLTRFGDEITDTQRQLLLDFVQLKNTKGFERKYLILKNKFFKHKLIPTLRTIIRA